jgi:hypothetical protein
VLVAVALGGRHPARRQPSGDLLAAAALGDLTEDEPRNVGLGAAQRVDPPPARHQVAGVVDVEAVGDAAIEEAALAGLAVAAEVHAVADRGPLQLGD